MKRLLVTGASGFLGWNVCEFPQEDWEILGIYHDHKDGIPDYIQSYQVDLRAQSAFEQVLERTQADAVLHLAANSNPKYCEENPSTSYSVNVGASRDIAQICQDLAIPMVFASSEQVYSGMQENNSEEDELKPINAYGRQKLTAEQKIMRLHPEACIARMAVMFGDHGPSARCFMHEWLNRWEKGEAVTAFTDEIRCFLSGYSAAEGLFLLLERQASGIYNIGGKDAISRFDFALKLAEKYGIKNPKIKAASQKDIPGLAETRPANLSMDLGKIEGFGFVTRTVDEELSELVGTEEES